MTYERACLLRGPTDSNSSIIYFGLSVFSVIWEICFSLETNTNGMKTSDSGTLLAHGSRLLHELHFGFVRRDTVALSLPKAMQRNS